ncbi:tannase/feruloyl esterase family alpha/beta hydrolase [Pusillimonas noertemannii]|uniref:Feruloyl esterase n=1 Tax=Pusillimonas noertemannii TaxID=305977 RepID=A0A2U1CPA0_9BURK|nr:tannase/feruloyl esterase family alpha/beta hydrolase [Pusillimonas noertemannii]NYT67036.1 tannase/feruloyl esterase family alpha/beta hydrolase [Pusillimonas noertemannii]PVY67709.1 feruloyl esterase [Pusillimonas noertemannii]TFL12754.1 tannase/feruloyl esterase family alpha/beta hydrolase [Pusillimonas noertemannii]
MHQHRTGTDRRGWICKSLATTIGTGVLLGLAACGGSSGNDKDSKTPLPLAQACPSYTSDSLPNGAKVTSTEIRAATGNMTEACIVRGEIVTSDTSTILWAVELPEFEDWNGKTLTVGGGAFDGFIPTDEGYIQAFTMPAANKFVRISSDSGHQSQGFEWAVDDDALKNHGYMANHLALQVGVQVAQDFFKKEPTHRYMIGQSNGGRSGLAAAQMFPEDYHGIVALEPAISQQAHEVNVGGVLMKHIFSNRDNWLNAAQIKLYAEAETRACDGLDGLEDGIIGNVEACNYVPDELLCTGASNDSCLTAGQIETIRLVYADKELSVEFTQGQRGYPRFGRGGASTSDWASYLFGRSFEEPASFDYMVGDEAARVVENDPDATLMSHDPTLYQAEYMRLAKELDATNPDLSAFHANGGKLLVWYGLSDTCVSLYRTVDYLKSVEEALGKIEYSEFVRFVTSPGIGHNLDGPGAGEIDFVGVIDDWVETGKAPEQLIGSHFEQGATEPSSQRPACQYPLFPRYMGGDETKAESFACVAS